MTSVSIVGSLAGGQSTALGLLHESLILYALQNKRFQIGGDFVNDDELNSILNKLGRGEFPNKTEPGHGENARLTLKFKNIFGWKTINFDFHSFSGEDIERVLERIQQDKSIQEIIADLKGREVIQGLLDSEVIIFVVDATSCDPTISKEILRKQVENDFFIARLWGGIKAYKNKTNWNVKGLGIIFAKYDEAQLFMNLGEVEYYTERDLDTPLPKNTKSLKTGAAVAPFEETIKKFLPQSWVTMRNDVQKIGEKNLRYFLSVIQMKADEETGKSVMMLPLTFTAGEYVRLVKWLSSI